MSRVTGFIEFQSTLPVRGATVNHFLAAFAVLISIHAPRAGSDVDVQMGRAELRQISIHAPRAGSDYAGSDLDKRMTISIHAPRAGSDIPPNDSCSNGNNFNPRSPCGERRFRGGLKKCRKNFNPRSPCGERPGREKRAAAYIQISIHAPRAGSDQRKPKGLFLCGYFNPRSPCGERHLRKGAITPPKTFQSTLPVRGATPS